MVEILSKEDLIVEILRDDAFKHIYSYCKTLTLPEDEKEAKKVYRESPDYFVNDNILYRIYVQKLKG